MIQNIWCITIKWAFFKILIIPFYYLFFNYFKSEQRYRYIRGYEDFFIFLSGNILVNFSNFFNPSTEFISYLYQSYKWWQTYGVRYLIWTGTRNATDEVIFVCFVLFLFCFFIFVSDLSDVHFWQTNRCQCADIELQNPESKLLEAKEGQQLNGSWWFTYRERDKWCRIRRQKFNEILKLTNAKLPKNNEGYLIIFCKLQFFIEFFSLSLSLFSSFFLSSRDSTSTECNRECVGWWWVATAQRHKWTHWI